PIRAATVEGFARASSPRVVPALATLLYDPSERVAAAAARTLGKVGLRSAVPDLRAALGSWTAERESVAQAVLEVLTALGSAVERDAVRPLLGSASDATAAAAARFFAKYGSREAVRRLTPLVV